MITVLKKLRIPEVKSCIHLNGNRLLIIGKSFIKMMSMINYTEIKSVYSLNFHQKGIVTRDEKYLYVTTSSGLQQYSIPNLQLMNTFRPQCDGFCLKYLPNKNGIIFNDLGKVLYLDLNNSSIIESQNEHVNNIYCIEYTSNEQSFVTNGSDKTLKKWSTDSLSLIKSVYINFPGISIVIKESVNAIMVLSTYGKVYTFSLVNLSQIIVTETSNTIRKLIRISDNLVASCIDRGYVALSSTKVSMIKVSNTTVDSISLINNNRIACVSRDEISIVSLPPPPDFAETIMCSIESEFDSIRSSKSNRDLQLLSLLQKYLSKLLTKFNKIPPRYTGHSITLSPDLLSLQRSYYNKGIIEGQTRVLKSHLFLKINAKDWISDTLEASIHLFKQKIQIVGTITNKQNILENFRVKQIKKRHWIFNMNESTIMSHRTFVGSARVVFKNGFFTCFVIDGHIVDKSDFQNTIEVNGILKIVNSYSSDGTIVTSDKSAYRLNFKTNRIEELNI